MAGRPPHRPIGPRPGGRAEPNAPHPWPGPAPVQHNKQRGLGIKAGESEKIQQKTKQTIKCLSPQLKVSHSRLALPCRRCRPLSLSSRWGAGVSPRVKANRGLGTRTDLAEGCRRVSSFFPLHRAAPRRPARLIHPCSHGAERGRPCEPDRGAGRKHVFAPSLPPSPAPAGPSPTTDSPPRPLPIDTLQNAVRHCCVPEDNPLH